MFELFKVLFLMDIVLFIFRRYLYAKFRIRTKDFFLTLMAIQFVMALAKVLKNYIVSKRKSSAKKPLEEDKGVPISNHPYLRGIK